MATTNTSVRRDDSSGNQIKTVTTVTLDNSYPTGGEPLTAAQLGLNVVQDAVCQVQVPGGGGVVAAEYDIANAKLKAQVVGFDTDALVFGEAAAEADLSDAVVQVTAWGYR